MKEKEDCWEELQVAFMSRTNGVLRSVQALKTCWENMKKRTKDFSLEKQEMYKTGNLNLSRNAVIYEFIYIYLLYYYIYYIIYMYIYLYEFIYNINLFAQDINLE